MEIAFHEQFYRMKPEMSINDLVEVKQYEHESTEDFMMRFRRTRIRCQFPINHAQLIFVAQKALWLPLRKKFYDVQFNELQELVIATTKYEKLLLEEHKAAIHQVDFEELKPEQNDGHGREGMDMCVAEMTTPFKPLIVKGLVQPVKDQKVVVKIYEEFVRARVIVPDSTKKMPKPEELKRKKYCKLHYTSNQSITNCVQFRDWIQDLIVKGKLLLEKPQANMMIDMDPFLEAPINMINLMWAEKGNGRSPGK
ncbi:hypothetical protein ACFX14_018908 [Malus domestica]